MLNKKDSLKIANIQGMLLGIGNMITGEILDVPIFVMLGASIFFLEMLCILIFGSLHLWEYKIKKETKDD